MKRVLLYVVVWLLACLSPTRVVESSDQCKAWLVQSIPTDMPELPRISGVLSTGSSLLLAFQQLYYYLLFFLSTKICLLSIVSSVFYVSSVFVDFGNLVLEGIVGVYRGCVSVASKQFNKITRHHSTVLAASC